MKVNQVTFGTTQGTEATRDLVAHTVHDGTSRRRGL